MAVFGHHNHKNAVYKQPSVKEEEHDPKGKFNGAKGVQHSFIFNSEHKGSMCKKLFMKEEV